MACKQFWGFGVRHVQLFLIYCFFALIHAMRVAPLASVRLVQQEREDTSSYHEDPFKNAVMSWSNADIAQLDRAIYYLYPWACFLGGLLSVKLNNKVIMLLCMFFMSTICVMIPAAVRSRTHKLSWAALYSMRLSTALFQGIAEPVSYQILGRWTLDQDVLKSSVILPAGEVQAASIAVMASTLSGWLLSRFIMFFIGKKVQGWTSIYYSTSNLGILWCVAWFTFGSKDHRSCFYISSDEKALIASGIADIDSYGIGEDKRRRPLRWKQILKTKDLCVLLGVHMLTQWAQSNVLVTKFMEKYLQNNPSDLLANDLVLIVYYVLVHAMVIIAWCLDYLIAQKKIKLSHQRKTCNTFGLWGQAIVMIMLGYSTNQPAHLVIGLAFHLPAASVWFGMEVALLDMAPNYAGFIYGIIKSTSNLPLAVLLATTDSSMDRHRFRLNLFIAALVFFLANFIYITAFETKRHDWNIGKDLRAESNSRQN